MSFAAALSTQWVIFHLADGEYALPVETVTEILRMMAITPLPEAPSWFVGVVNLRGQVIPVLDLRRRLGLPPRPVDLNTPILVAKADGRSVGLIADAVTEVLTLPAEAVQPPDSLAGSTHPIAAIARIGGRLILSFDPVRLCAGAESLALPDL